MKPKRKKQHDHMERIREQNEWLSDKLLEACRLINQIVAGHDCDLFAAHLGDNDYECRLCGNSWEEL